jgi:hypothetical protein
MPSAISITDTEISSITSYLAAIGIDSSAQNPIDITTLISTTGLSSAGGGLNSNYFDNSTTNESEFKGLVNTSKASHESQVTFNYLTGTANITALLKGTVPLFNGSPFFSTNTSGTYTISRASDGSSLQIGSTTLTAASFAEGVVPLKAIIVLGGGGGGGGGGNLVANGSGGGGGALAIYVISLMQP